MDIRECHFGGIATSIAGTDEVKVDVGAVIRRLILFEQVKIESIRLKEFPLLIAIFGAEGLIDLLDSGCIDVICDGQTSGQIGQNTVVQSSDRRGGPLPLESYRLATVGILQEGPDRENYVHNALQEIHKAPISVKLAQKVKLALLSRLRTYPLEFVHAATTDTHTEIIRNNSFIWEAIRFATHSEIGLDIGHIPDFTVEDLGNEGDIRIATNLSTNYGLPVEQVHKLVERGILAAAGVNQRIRLMEGFEAVTGFQKHELPLFDEKLSFLARQIDPEEQEVHFERVVTIAGLPDVEDLLSTGRTVDVARLLKVRDSPECRDLRSWIRNVDTQTDEEIGSQFEDVRSRLASVVESRPGKSVRFLVTTGSAFIPVAGPFISPLLSAGDAFLLERLIGCHPPGLRDHPSATSKGPPRPLFRAGRL